LRANAAIHKEALQSGIGWTTDENDVLQPPSFAETPEEKAISLQAHKKNKAAAYDRLVKKKG
jgi:hypothetical protein